MALKNDRSVLITGGNKGIGLKITERFLSLDKNIIVVARNFDNFPYIKHKQISCVEFDFSNIGAVKEMINNLPPVDVLINNAGLMYGKFPDDYTSNMRDYMLNVNLISPMTMMHHLGKKMSKHGCGRIVNIASIAGQIGHPDVWYGATKAGIINATKSFASMFARHGVIVNAVAPGPVETDMLNVIPDFRKNKILENVLLGRFALPDEVAGAAVWLATDSPEYITGTCIDINNGMFFR